MTIINLIIGLCCDQFPIFFAYFVSQREFETTIGNSGRTDIGMTTQKKFVIDEYGYNKLYRLGYNVIFPYISTLISRLLNTGQRTTKNFPAFFRHPGHILSGPGDFFLQLLNIYLDYLPCKDHIPQFRIMLALKDVFHYPNGVLIFYIRNESNR